ncbi:hypothetical protein ACJJTC_010467 [Scirpophaga incertulas]
MKIENFLVKCYLDDKFILCAELCALYKDYLLSTTFDKLHILVGLKEKLTSKDLLNNIDDILQKFDNLKTNNATQLKSGIFVLDNTYCLLEDDIQSQKVNEPTYSSMSPEPMQALKDLSNTVTDKLSISKKKLKEKWEDLEGKMKTLGNEKQITQEFNIPKRTPAVAVEYMPELVDDNIIFKESSQKAIDVDNKSLASDKVCKSLYQYFRLSLVGKESDQSNLVFIIESYACDIGKIYQLMLELEQYCVAIGALEESKYVPNNIFLTYLNCSSKKNEFLESVVHNEMLYKYFVDSCICVNMKTQKLSNIGCDCGFPLPYTRTNTTPMFSNLIDEFIERQWSSQSRDQCYEVCRKMPYLWRKILYLRRNEDLLNVLRVLLQMLDESLLHSFLPQFTLESWDRAIQLYSTLHANMCLNCNKTFHHVSVKDMLSWDDLGALIIKSVGGKNAIKILEKHAKLVEAGELTLKFYHTALLVAMYEACDVTITSKLTDALYFAYEFQNCRNEICSILCGMSNGRLKNTALPIIVAAKSSHWGLSPIVETITLPGESSNEDNDISNTVCTRVKDVSFNDIINNISSIYKYDTDCILCGLPLQNDYLIKDGGLWVFKCGHTFHGSCLDLNKVKLCPTCPKA